jgi:Zn-dependent protease/CBS domain-containing protein
MRWSFKIGRIVGIDVYMHFTFLLLLGFVALANWTVERTAAAAVSGVVFFLLLFACVLLHECGHALAARRYGIPTRDITLLPIGGVARLDRMPDKPIQELWVAVAGPLVNVVIAGGLLIGLLLKGGWHPDLSQMLNTTRGALIERLIAVNLFLVIFNMLPAFPMDGGRVLRALLALKMPYARATNIAASIGQAMAFLFGFIGLFGNPLLLFIALFVWIGAAQEAAAAHMKASLEGYRVRDAMLTDFRVLHPEQTMGDAARLILAGSQQDFPVLESNGRVIGMLMHDDLFKALQQGGESTPVGSVMRRELDPLQDDELLENAIRPTGPSENGFTRPVLRRDELIGMLTAENVGEFLMIRAALAGSHRGRSSRIVQVPPVIRRAAYGGAGTNR